ncbi:olfactory receptor 8B3-like [Ovis aries]|uniref:olfactory receptor 8B3-like n=1 Tax=Ovis aries TaxID=9940 RepID=UPI001C2EC063|nr:olfactory receptor 8B3-like [Ovis aries]
MDIGNKSLVTEFILAGLTEHSEIQEPLFFLFLGIYIITMAGNLGLVTISRLTSHLHTLMCYFLLNLFHIGLCYSSVITLKLLVNFMAKRNTISYTGCMTQQFLYCFFVNAECYVLTMMAYDCYVAICKPLLYKVTMSPQVCSLMAVILYKGAFIAAWIHTGCMLKLTFCDANAVNHYMCDILPLLELSCTNTHISELVVLIIVGFDVGVPSLIIIVSYVFILFSILHISSTEGRSKAFSTCSSHIIVVSVSFGSEAFMYLHPSVLSMNQNKVSTVFYTIVVPILKPLIHSFRNKEVKVALKKTLSRKISF